MPRGEERLGGASLPCEARGLSRGGRVGVRCVSGGACGEGRCGCEQCPVLFTSSVDMNKGGMVGAAGEGGGSKRWAGAVSMSMPRIGDPALSKYREGWRRVVTCVRRWCRCERGSTSVKSG